MRQIGGALATVVAVVGGAFWVLALGAIGLWVFFSIFGVFSPRDPAWLTLVVGALALLAALHFVRARKAMDADDELARRIHMMRERRGF